MLRNILVEIEKSHGVISLSVLSSRLGIQKSALHGIIQTWVRKGKIQLIEDPAHDDAMLCLDACSQGANNCHKPINKKNHLL